MPTKPRRKTYRHGNVRAEAITAAWRLIAKAGQFIIHFGGITQYTAGILDLPNEDALVVELSAMTAGT